VWRLKKIKKPPVSDASMAVLTKWLVKVIDRAGLSEDGLFLSKKKMRSKGCLGSGGMARFRDTLWAAALGFDEVSDFDPEALAVRAEQHRVKVKGELQTT
jgi:hypothetical protein